MHSGSLLRGQDSLGVVRGAARLGAGEFLFAPFSTYALNSLSFSSFCRQGGKFIFLEHVAAEQGTVLRALQWFLSVSG